MNDIETYRLKPAPRGLVAVPPPILTPGKSDAVDFHALLAAFRRHFWRFTGITTGVFILSIAFTMMATPIYVATARLAIDTREVQVAPTTVSGSTNAPVVSSLGDDTSAIDTEVAIIGSRRVAQRVVSALHLDQDPEFARPRTAHRNLKQALMSLFRVRSGGSPVTPAELGSTPAIDHAVDVLLTRLKVARFNLTYAIDISFSDADPQKAAAIANAFAQSYIIAQIASKVETDDQANSFLRDQLGQMLQESMSDEAKLQNYKIAHNMMSSGATTLTEQEISSYNESDVQAKAEAAADQANLDTARAQLARGSNGEDVGGALSSGVIQALRTQRATISAHVADLQSRYGDKYPELQVAERQLADTDHQIQAEINRVVSNLEAKAEVSKRRLASLEGSLSETKDQLSQNNEAQVGLDQLQQNANASSALYESYLNRVRETAAQRGGERSDARILSLAPLPTHAATPRVWLNLLLGLLVGGGLGLTLVVISEIADTGVTTADDVERRVGQHYLGGIPLLTSVLHKSVSPIDEIVQSPYSAYSEAIRNLHVSIRHAAPVGQPCVAAISSALPREGKTTVAISLARSAAMQGIRTVLVDCDLRHRGINQLVAVSDNRPGLIEILTGRATLADALVLDEASGAMVLALRVSRSPDRDIFGSHAMDALLTELRRGYELVVLDSPPLLPVAEGRVVAGRADMLVMIMRWRKTSVAATRIALRLAPSHLTSVAGVAITQIDMHKQAKYGYGDPGYYYNHYKQYYQ